MKRGVTLIELLISITVSSMVFILVGTTLAFFMEKNVKNRRQELFDQVKNNLSVEITNAVKWATEVRVLGNEIKADGATYKFVSQDIQKNGSTLLPPEIIMTGINVQDLTTDPRTVSLMVDIDLESKNYSVAKDSLKLVVSQRRTEVEL